jgi:hypothetical protein
MPTRCDHCRKPYGRFDAPIVLVSFRVFICLECWRALQENREPVNIQPPLVHRGQRGDNRHTKPLSFHHKEQT